MSKLNTLAVLWILFGVILMCTGAFFVYYYNKTGIMHLLALPNYCSIAQIFMSGYSILLGIKIFQKSKNAINISVLFSVYLIGVFFGSFVHDLISGFNVIITWLYSGIYILIIPFISETIKTMQSHNVELDVIKPIRVLRNKNKSIIIYTIILVSITVLVSLKISN